MNWFGTIPNDWEERPLWTILHPRKNKNSEGKEQNLLSLSYGHIIRKNIDTATGLLPESFNGYNIIEKGDIVLRLTDLQNDMRSLRTGLAKEHGIITSAYLTLVPKEGYSSSYYHYILHSYDIMKGFYNMGEGIRQGLGYDELSRLSLPVPSISEQSRIATFLDECCGKIDEAIARHDALIKKLDEYRKAVITKAVKCCESDLRKLKFCVKLCTEKAETKDNYIALENIEGQTGKYIGNKILPDGEAVVTKRGYVLFGKLRPYLAKCYVTEQDGCCSGEFLVMNPQIVSARFLQYVLLEQTLVDRINMSTYGTKMPRANWGFIGNQLIPVPSPSEQQGIVAFLDKKCIAIDSAKERHTQLITKLEEYKKSLIYNAVTGKIEC